LASEVEILREQVANLEAQLELANSSVENITLSDNNPMSGLIYAILNKDDRLSGVEAIYRKIWNVINYMLICGVGGTTVNYIILSVLVNILPLLIADVIAILTAALWNYTFTVGPLGYLAGLSMRKPDKFKNAKEWV
jgi:hypothetical protein